MCDCPPLYHSFHTATANATTNFNSTVSSSASARASSNISQEDADIIARIEAERIAQSVADNQANLVDQTVVVMQQNNIGTGATGPAGPIGPTGPSSSSGSSSSNYNALIIGNTGTYNLTTPGVSDPNVLKIINGNANPYVGLANGGLNTYNYTSIVMAKSGNYLYVGGSFSATNDNSITLNNIGKYDVINNTWSQLTNNGLNGRVTALTFDSTGRYLFVGGYFSDTVTPLSPANTLNSIAVYDTTDNTWHALANKGLGTSGSGVNSILYLNATTLYVGGYFSATGDGTISSNLNNIAKYTITNIANSTGTWVTLPQGGLDNAVNTIVLYSGNILYIGGAFAASFSGATTGLNNITSFDITGSYTALASQGLAGSVSAIFVYNNLLYIGGFFAGTSTSLPVISRNIVIYNPQSGGSWTSFPNQGLDSSVLDIQYINGLLYLSGYFGQTQDGTIALKGIATYNLSNNSWSSLLLNGLVGATFQTMYYNSNTIFIVGGFTTTSTVSATVQGYIPNLNYITKYNPNNNSLLNINYNSSNINTLYTFGTYSEQFYANNTWNLLQ